MDNPKPSQPSELEIEPAGEANTTAPVAPPINDAVEPPQTEPIQAPIESVPAPETTETEALSEPIPETPTAQMGRNEPLPESVPTAETPSAEVPTAAPEPAPTSTQGTAQAPEPTPTPESLPAQAPHSIIALLLEKAKLTIQFRKQKKLVKIMTLFAKKSHITNDEVEKLLHVSDATATRYLSELEKRGTIKQTGKTGQGVTYTKR